MASVFSASWIAVHFQQTTMHLSFIHGSGRVDVAVIRYISFEPFDAGQRDLPESPLAVRIHGFASSNEMIAS